MSNESRKTTNIPIKCTQNAGDGDRRLEDTTGYRIMESTADAIIAVDIIEDIISFISDIASSA
ncbi:MAG: hypothetical protein WCO00_17055 [Rhodospirillaceae bacterium]